MSDRPAFYLGARGLVIGWHGALGPTIARYGSSSRERPEFVLGLGHPGADLPETPELLVGPEHIAAFWCEEDGAWGACFDLEGDALRDPELVLPGAARIALASGQRGTVLFGADGKGLSSVRLDALGEPVADAIRYPGETRPAPRLSAVWLYDECLCVAVHVGEPAWSTLALGAGQPQLVRHRYRAPIDDLRVRSAGSRAAVLLGARSGVELAIVSGSGRVIERPHAVFPQDSGPLSSPDAVWADDRWVVLAHAPDTATIKAQPLAKQGATKSRPPMFDLLPHCAGPFSAIYRSQTYYALEVEPAGDDAEMRLGRCDKTGDGQQQRIDIVEHRGAPRRRQRRAVRSALASLARTMGQARGYREHAARPSLTRDGASLELLDERGRLNVSVVPDDASEALAVRIASALGDDPELEEAPSSMVRLAAWIRGRLSPSVREANAQRLAWATELARTIDARVQHVDRAGNTLVLDLLMDALPDSEALWRWLDRVREAQAEAP